jgi:hypothetical protein
MCITLEYTGISSATTPAVKNPICAVVRNYGGPLSVHTSDRPHGPVVGACSGVLARLFVRLRTSFSRSMCAKIALAVGAPGGSRNDAKVLYGLPSRNRKVDQAFDAA